MKDEKKDAPEENEQTTPTLDQIMTDGRPSVDDVAPDSGSDTGPAADADLLVGSPQDAPMPPQDSGEQTPLPPKDTPLTPPSADPPAITRRFKSHEDAEKGYRELQREKTIADSRIQTLTEEIQRQKKQEKEAQDRQVEEQSFTDYAQTRNEQALKEIDEIDPDDPDYRKKAAAAWARANKDIRFWKPAAQEAAPEAPKGEAPPAAPQGQSDQQAVDDAREYVCGQLEAVGLKPDDRLFWSIARTAPTKDAQGQPLELDAQIQWALAETKNYRDAILHDAGATPPVAAAADKKAKDAQAREMPLGRSPADRAESPPATTPVSMAEAISYAQERRRL